MKLLILGATGNMGQRLLAQGLARGHAITAFVRNRAKLQQQLGTAVPPGLAVFEGDVNDATALRAAMTGQDVVINCAATWPTARRSSNWWTAWLRRPKARWVRAGACGCSVARPRWMCRARTSWGWTCRACRRSTRRTRPTSGAWRPPGWTGR
ncbi:MAG: NAD(P)H-binding protein [Comamonadaceae bacterium]|nr:NAD(P)H-binding protein [Comamonadaceae bacterium]